MKTFNIIIKSKNQISIKKFLRFLKKRNIINFKIIQKCFFKKKKKKFITLLKSPHVNKSAQEQFEIKINSIQLKIQSIQPFKFLIMLKKIKINLFPDISIKLKLINKNNLLKQKVFNLDNFEFKFKPLIINKNIKLKKIKFYINTNKKILTLFDIYGA